MGRNWAESLFPGETTPTMDSPEEIQKCLNCTIPAEFCAGNLHHCRERQRNCRPRNLGKQKYIAWTAELVADVMAGKKSRNQLARELGVSPTAVRNAIARLKNKGELN